MIWFKSQRWIEHVNLLSEEGLFELGVVWKNVEDTLEIHNRWLASWKEKQNGNGAIHSHWRYFWARRHYTKMFQKRTRSKHNRVDAMQCLLLLLLLLMLSGNFTVDKRILIDNGGWLQSHDMSNDFTCYRDRFNGAIRAGSTTWCDYWL